MIVFAARLNLLLWLFPALAFADSNENRSAIYPTAIALSVPSGPIRLNQGPHLFLDEFLIASSSNVIRQVNMPKRETTIPNPVVTGPEDGSFQPYLTVLRDPESSRFRIWYGARTEDSNPNRSRIGYMESDDGIRWRRPHRLLDDPSTIQFGVSVLDEGVKFQPSNQRFKFAWWFGGGLRIASSPDGFKWATISPDPVIMHNHDITGIHWDAIRHRYVATASYHITGPTWSGQRRITKHSSSSDLLHWREPWIVLAPNDRVDEGETQFYAMDGYLRRGDLIVGMVKVLRDDLKADQPPDPPDAYGIGYTTLAWTRDGEHWVRDRERFFDRHPDKSAWDHAHAWIDEQVPVGDEVYLYYGGYMRGHKVNRFAERQIGLVKMKRDRYVARAAGYEGGFFRTPLVKIDSDSMILNVASTDGEVRVQILDERGKPHRGFTAKDCRPVSTDSVTAPVQWKKRLSALAGKLVQFEFHLRNARLYAFELKGGVPAE